MKPYQPILLMLFTLVLGCKNHTADESSKPEIIRVGSFLGTEIADTIVYDVIIRNPDPQDAWTTECLKNLKQRMLIDSVFDLVYAEKLKAFDFFTQEVLSLKEIKKIESETGYSRDLIGKIQFTERWFFDKSTRQFQKEVISLVFGYELFNSEGAVRGYKPVFKIYLNH
jgi:hypothetical protein